MDLEEGPEEVPHNGDNPHNEVAMSSAEAGILDAEAGPSTAPDCTTALATEEGCFDPELLQALGDFEADVVEYGDDVQPELATRFQKILISGLQKETKDEILKKYLYPKNLFLAKGPTLNPEIAAMLVETCKLRDKRLLTKQDQLGKALSALGKAMTILMKKNADIPDVIRTLNDAGKILADSHYAETDTRRSVIMPLIDKSLMDPFKDRKRDNFLFGENLSDLVKNSRGIKNTSQLIQPPVSSHGNLNGRGSSSRGARNQRGAGNQTFYRAGGPRQMTSYQHPTNRRRTQPAAHPPPPSRRQPPPPPARRQPASYAHRYSSTHRRS